MVVKENYFGKYNDTKQSEYAKPQINILEQFKNVQQGKVPNTDLLIPLYRWYSNNINNIHGMQFINKHFFHVNNNILCRTLVLNIDRKERFIKSLPKKKEHKLDFLDKYVKKYYNWSDNDLRCNKHLIDYNDKELHSLLDSKFVFEPKELKILGMKRIKIKTKFEKTRKTRSYF